MQLEILNIEGKATSKKVTLNEKIFGIEPNDHAIYLDVKQHGANKRQGTHKVKTRSEISGSTKKLKNQKGSGSARYGDIKSGLFVGGGSIFGPVPRDYSFKLNKKLKQLARRSALSYKAKDNQITVIEDIKFDSPKTSKYVEFLKNIKMNDKKILVLLGEYDKNLYLSSRNLYKCRVMMATDVNTYDILNSNQLVLSESSIKVIENILNPEAK